MSEIDYFETSKNLEKHKGKYKKVREKIIFWIIIIMAIYYVAIIEGMAARIYSSFCNVVSNNYKSDKDIDLMNKFNSEQYDNLRGEEHRVKNFSMEKNTFNFLNFSTSNSEKGVCNGFALLEKAIFLNKIPKAPIINDKALFDITFIDKDLSKYRLDVDTKNKLYHKKDIVYDKPVWLTKQYDIYKPYSSDKLYKLDIGENLEDFSKANIKKSQVLEILKAINYCQIKDIPNLEPTQYNPYKYSSYSTAYAYIQQLISSKLILFNQINSMKFRNKFDITDITSKIDKNEPVVVGIGNNIEGHAVLAYSYEKINNNIVKVHVADSNLPLLDSATNNDKVNRDILNNDYMVFKKINGRWQYKYDPCINGNYIYNGIFNSYIPDTIIKIY